MGRIYRTPNLTRVAKSKAEFRHEQYGKAEKGVLVCKVCHDVFYKKEWHKPADPAIKNAILKGKGVHFGLCPADKMTRGGSFEGEISIKNVPAKFSDELFNLIAGFGHRASMRDPQDRIIAIKKQGSGFYVTTTENQLAVKLAKKISDSFKHHAKVKISYGAEPEEVSRIEIVFSK